MLFKYIFTRLVISRVESLYSVLLRHTLQGRISVSSNCNIPILTDLTQVMNHPGVAACLKDGVMIIPLPAPSFKWCVIVAWNFLKIYVKLKNIIADVYKSKLLCAIHFLSEKNNKKELHDSSREHISWSIKTFDTLLWEKFINLVLDKVHLKSLISHW